MKYLAINFQYWTTLIQIIKKLVENQYGA